MHSRDDVRLACPADAYKLAAIDASVNLNPWSETQFAAACNAGRQQRDWALVVEQADHISGFVVAAQVLDEASIHSIAVNPAQQRRGLGQLLLNAALRRMQIAGVVRCLLEVRHSNRAAQRFYEHNGFVLDGVRKNYYPTDGGREDALLMSKALKGIANERA